MALKGIKVIELAGLAPVPFCGMILADFGAEVLRVDKLNNAMADGLGNGKKSIALNLKNQNGVKILRDLCKTSDVLIEPFRKGVMEKLGLGPELLLKDNPRLIYARLTGYGQNGPFSNSAGHDINYLSLSGLLSLFGRHNEKPIFPANITADFGGGGLTCALGILLALLERNSSGLGQVIDSNMVEGTAYLGSWLFRSQNSLWGNLRGKNLLDSGSHFYEVYETKDGKYMSVGALEPQFYQLLLNGLGIKDDELSQFSDWEEGKKVLEKKFKEKTQKEWCEIFDNVDACVTPVLSIEEVMEHPHNKERQTFVKTKDCVIPKPAPLLSRTPGKTCGIKKAPEIGEHTIDVLKQLGYSENKIGELMAEGAVNSAKSKL